MNDLFQELQGRMGLLERALGELGKRGRENAQAEMDYRVALAEKMLQERDKGTPVTIVSDVCRGDKGIALLKFKRDCAEVSYKAALEAINIYKVEIKSLEEQIGREWHRN